MRTKLSLLVILILIVVGGLFLFKDTTHTVVSADGSLSLDVDPGTLPKGISIESIVIEKDETDVLSVNVDGVPASAIYTLAPDGLTFGEPVAVRITVPITSEEEAMLPALYHLSGTTLARLDVGAAEYTDEGLVLHTEIEHFSRIILTEDVFETTVHHPHTALVGEQFSVTATTKKTQTKNIMEFVAGPGVTFGENMRGTHRGTITREDPWELEGKLTATPGNIVTPAEIVQAPAKTEVSAIDGENSFTYEGVFTCSRPGKVSFTYTTIITAQEELTWDTPTTAIDIETSDEPITTTHPVRFLDGDDEGTIMVVDHVECLPAPAPEGGGEDDDDTDEDTNDDDDSDDDTDDQKDEKKKKNGDCPDCAGLEQELGEKQAQRDMLAQDVRDAEDALDDFDEAELDTDLDKLIAEAGCDPSQDPGGELESGQSSGTVTSRDRSFFCPHEAAVEALTEALDTFWEGRESPSTLREEIRTKKEDIEKLDTEIKDILEELEDCPCPEPEFEEGAFEFVGAQYFSVCPDGTVLSGYSTYDAQGNEITDAAGNSIDRDTGQSVVCPG